MGSDGDETAFVQEQDPIRILNRGKPVGHHKEGLVPHLKRQ